MPNPPFFASDVSTNALEVASENAARHGLEKNVQFFSGDWFHPFNNTAALFDVIVSNPPYIRSDDMDKLQPEICKYEPRMALESEKDGLGAIRHIIQHAYLYLSSGGYLLLEIDHHQKDDVERIAGQTGQYERASFSKDYSGYYRVAEMKKVSVRK